MEITIDGRRVKASEGETILAAARRERIFIPSLCHDDKLEPYTSCFLCVVRVKGAARLSPSCSTRVADGMEIFTADEEVLSTRRMCLELLLSRHCGECMPPCQIACPAGCDARGYINMIMDRRYDDALRIIMETIPLPETIGRICPHPCEDECRRTAVEQPLAICALKRFAADRARSSPPVQRQPSSGRRAAIIGAGPAGLSAAYFLALSGHEVVIFEAREKGGGMLRYGIPEYRLPSGVLDREIGLIARLGVRIEYGAKVGEKISIGDLRRERYGAVLIACGAQLNRRMGIEGEACEGVFKGIEFLSAVASGERPRLGRSVFVVGGGDTATDAARTALRLGAREVTIVYRRSREEMPASASEIRAAEAEGIEIRLLTLPVKITRSNGRLEVTCSRMALGEPDESGRRRPVAIPGSEYAEPCNAVVMAVGQTVDASVLRDSGLAPTEGGRIGAHRDTFMTSLPGVFACGDCVTGPDIAIAAVAAGRKAAYAIDSYLRTGKPSPLPEPLNPASRKREEIEAAEYADVERRERARLKEKGVAERIGGFEEVEEVLEEQAALAEAARCLDCGCGKTAECTIRELSGDLGVRADRFGSMRREYALDERHPHIVRDPNKCIKCGRCIRVCNEVQAIDAWGYVGRGFEMQVAPPFGLPLQDTECESCGQCVTTCPTGALVEKPVIPKALSSRAAKTETICAHCGIGCPIAVHVAGFRVARITPLGNGNLCKKGKFDFTYLTDSLRIISPLLGRGGRRRRAGWDEVRKAVREGIAGIPGERAAIFVSARATNEEALAAQEIARRSVRTNNIYPSSGMMISKRLHHGLSPFVSPRSIEDIAAAGAVVLMNPSTIVQNEVAALPMIRAARGGARLLVIGGRKTKLDRFASKKLTVNPDRFEEYAAELESLSRDFRRIVVVYNRCCLGEEAILSLHRLAKRKRLDLVSLCTEINEQGLLESGVSPFLLPGQRPMGDREARRRFDEKWGRRIPVRPGRGHGDILSAMKRGEIDVALFLGPHHEAGDELRKSLGKVRFVAAQALRSSSLSRLADVVLPAASWIETKGTFTRYDGKQLHLGQAIPPLCGYSNIEIWNLLFGTPPTP